MASAGLDMVGKMLANKGSEVNNRKAEQEIQNLKKTNEQITKNIVTGKGRKENSRIRKLAQPAKERSSDAIQ